MDDEIDPVEFKRVLAETEANYRAGKDVWVATTADIANYFMNCVPPEAWASGAFATGEPWRHNDQGFPIFLCFCHITDTSAQAKYLTINQFRNHMKELGHEVR